MTTTDTTIITLSFEDAMQQLEQIVRTLESGGKTLEDSIGLYTKGAALRSHCEHKLQEAKLKIEKLVLAADGTVQGTEPLAE